MRKGNLIFLVVTLLAGIAAAILAASGSWGVPGEWQWQHRVIQGERWWMPLPPSLALIGFSLWLLGRARERGRISAAWVLVFVVLACVLQLSTLAIMHDSTAYAGAVILSPVATTYFTEAAQVDDMRSFLRDYANRMPTFSQHAQTYPPGPIVFFWFRQQVIEGSAAVRGFAATLIALVTGFSPADLAGTYTRLYGRPVAIPEAIAAIVCAWQLGLIGCLSILLIFLLARDRWGYPAAVCAAAFSTAIPSFVLFTPSIAQLVAFETALTLYLFHLAWSRRSAAWGALAGAVWTIAALTSLAMLAIPPLLVLWALFDRVAGGARTSAGSPWRVALAWVGGSLALFALAYVVLGIDFPAIVVAALGAHREVTTQAFARTYSRWLGWNLFDFWMFLGAGLGLWLLRQMWTEMRAFGRGPRESLTPLLWAVVLTVAALDLSGVVRAEVGRIWMFLMLPAAAVAGRSVASVERADIALGVILATQLLQISAFERHLALFVVL